MEYTGNKRLLVWYGASLGYVDVMKGGKPVYKTRRLYPLKRIYLEKGSHITITEWTGKHTEKEANLTAGVYKVEGEIGFQIGEVYEDEPENNDYVYCRLSLPLMIQ